jgi:hypothetical protein
MWSREVMVVDGATIVTKGRGVSDFFGTVNVICNVKVATRSASAANTSSDQLA